ncbi:MAG: rhomboid family intramembrane serine protease, partial [Myxococcota bacterium]|nr:rhomboid family intramembrane serine protease [Myxococcota bacterium]
CLRCQFIWFDPGEFSAMPAALPAQGGAPDVPTRELPAAARMALVRAKMESIAQNTDMGPEVPDGLADFLAALFLLPVELEVDEPGLRRPALLTWTLCLAVLVTSILAFPKILGLPNWEPSIDYQAWALSTADPWRMGGVTLLSLFFLHGGWLHLLSNLYFLVSFGDNVEDLVGRLRFALLLVVATLVGSLSFCFVHSGEEILAVGASGGISGVLVAYVLLFPRAKLGFLFFWRWLIRVPCWAYLGVWILLQVSGATGEVLGDGSEVAYVAHLGGAAVGLAAWLLWRDRLR